MIQQEKKQKNRFRIVLRKVLRSSAIKIGAIIIVISMITAFAVLLDNPSENLTASISDAIKDIGDSPVFVTVSALPQKVKVGDTLTITAEIQDKYGIEKVTALMPHENGADEIELSLVNKETPDKGVSFRSFETRSLCSSCINTSLSTDYIRQRSLSRGLAVDNFFNIVYAKEPMGSVLLRGRSDPSQFQLGSIPRRGFDPDHPIYTYQAQWKVHNTINIEYITTITATNILGKTATAKVSWWDDTETKMWSGSPVGHGPWLTDYAYRKAILIDNTSGGALTDYQIQVTDPIYDETGLIGSWHLDGAVGAIANGDTVVDSSGQGNTGTASNSNGTGMAYATGKHDQGIDFDGTDDYVDVPDSTDWDFGSNPMTVSLWAKFDVIKDSFLLTQRSGASAGGFEFWYAAADTLTFSLSNLDNAVTKSWNPSTGIWYHLAYTRVGDTHTLYVDGSSIGSDTDAGSVADVTGVLRVGSRAGASTYTTEGKIDEPRVYNRALTASEIKQHYEAKAKLNYGDVRFTNSDSVTLIDHWAENDGTYWVEVPSISASETKTIYAYYGNSSATSASNGTNTFIAYHGVASANFHDSNIISGSFVYEAKVKATADSVDMCWGVSDNGDMDSAPSGDSAYLYAHYNTHTYIFASNDGTPTQDDEIDDFTLGTWYRLKIIYDSGTSAHYYKDSNEIASGITTNLPNEAMGLSFDIEGGVGEQAFSFVRKYAATEPIITNYAEQENLKFDYYKSIPISNGITSALTNYQVKITIGYSAGGDLNLGSNCETDFSDIRFGDSSGRTYSHWRESFTASGTAVFWVKIPSIYAGDSNDTTAEQTIYIYYGNSSATSASNGTNTFEEFLDKDSTSGWTTSNLTVSTSGDFLRFYNPTTSNNGIAHRLDWSTPTKWRLEARVKNIGLGTDDYGHIGTLDGSIDHRFTQSYTPYYNDQDAMWYYESGGKVKLGDIWTEGTEHIVVYQLDEGDSSTGVSYYLYDTSRTLLGSATGKAFAAGSPTDCDGIYIGDSSTSGKIDFYFRWLFLRKYAATEPTILTAGSQTTWSAKANYWQYRVPVVITNPGGSSAQENYQVLVTVDTSTPITANKMNSDGSDIRFSPFNNFHEEDWTKIYPYWIESGLNTASTKIWVKIDEIPAADTKTIYMYYGNPSATSASNGTNTFEFFDDFEYTGAQDSNKWDNMGADISVANGYATINAQEGIKSKSTYTGGALRSRTRIATYANLLFLPGFGTGTITNNTSNVSQFIGYVTPTVNFYTNDGAADENHDYGNLGTDWNNYDIKWLNSTHIKCDVNNADEYTFSVRLPPANRYIDFNQYGSSGVMDIDWVLYRKYAANEPTTAPETEVMFKKQDLPGVSPSGGGVMMF